MPGTQQQGPRSHRCSRALSFCLRTRKSAAVGLPLAAVLAEVFAALIFERLNGAVLAHGVGLRQIMDELLERNRAAVLGKVVGLERLADERRERQVARVARHVDGLVGHALGCMVGKVGYGETGKSTWRYSGNFIL